MKTAMVSRELRHRQVREVLIHTGQHYDTNMSDVFFDELEIDPPQHHLGIGSGTQGEQTGKMLHAIESILLQERPDRVLVYGDTNSTLAGALAAAKLHISVAHVEAGLRSFNRRMPEEINRVLTDLISELLFAPTETAIKNLENEGLTNGVHFTGDVMYDAALHFADTAERESRILEYLHLSAGQYILATIHRAENTDDTTMLHAIFDGFCRIASELPVVLPLHPRTKKALEREGLLNEVAQHVRFIEPVGYLDMIMLEKNARLIATDSGGIQKEAFFYRVPCVTLRSETEWVELVQLGWNRVIDPVSVEAVEAGLHEGLGSPEGIEAIPYGTGQASKEIVQLLLREE